MPEPPDKSKIPDKDVPPKKPSLSKRDIRSEYDIWARRYPSKRGMENKKDAHVSHPKPLPSGIKSNVVTTAIQMGFFKSWAPSHYAAIICFLVLHWFYLNNQNVLKWSGLNEVILSLAMLGAFICHTLYYYTGCVILEGMKWSSTLSAIRVKEMLIRTAVLIFINMQHFICIALNKLLPDYSSSQLYGMLLFVIPVLYLFWHLVLLCAPDDEVCKKTARNLSVKFKKLDLYVFAGSLLVSVVFMTGLTDNTISGMLSLVGSFIIGYAAFVTLRVNPITFEMEVFNDV